jgi:hypothetical protein
MDASRLTRLRREQASLYVATNKIGRSASETTTEVKYRNSGTFLQATSTIGLVEPCAIKTVDMFGANQSSSADNYLFRQAGVATCCSAKNNTKGLKVTLPVDCYSSAANFSSILQNPVLGNQCTPCFIGVRASPNNKGICARSTINHPV